MTAVKPTRRAARNQTTTKASIADLMKLSLSPAAIADRLGVALVTVRGLVKELDPSYSGKVTDQTAFGLSRESSWLRSQLGGMLFDLEETNKLTSTQSSAIVGLNRNERLQALQHPYNHNWTISQISRLAKAIGISVPDCLHRGIYKPIYGSDNVKIKDIPLSPTEVESMRSR